MLGFSKIAIRLLDGIRQSGVVGLLAVGEAAWLALLGRCGCAQEEQNKDQNGSDHDAKIAD